MLLEMSAFACCLAGLAALVFALVQWQFDLRLALGTEAEATIVRLYERQESGIERVPGSGQRIRHYVDILWVREDGEFQAAEGLGVSSGYAGELSDIRLAQGQYPPVRIAYMPDGAAGRILTALFGPAILLDAPNIGGLSAWRWPAVAGGVLLVCLGMVLIVRENRRRA